jgi:hypothetical protein
VSTEIQNAIVNAVNEAVSKAAREGNYESVVLVIIMLGGAAFVGFMAWLFLRRHLAVEERTLAESKAREDRMASRMDTQENMIRELQRQQNETLFTVIRDCTGVMGKMLAAADSIVSASVQMSTALTRFTTILEMRPCLLRAQETLRGTDPDSR